MQKTRRGTTRDRSADPGEIEETNQRISDAVDRLDSLGKTPADVIALFGQITSKDFDSEQWLADQVWSAPAFWTAIELACLCTFAEAQSGRFSADPTALTAIALWYGDVIRRQNARVIDAMHPDWDRGRRAREGGAERLDTSSEKRATRPDQVWEVLLDWVKHNKPLLNSLSKVRLFKRLADEFEKRHGTKISYKTVERDLKTFRLRK